MARLQKKDCFVFCVVGFHHIQLANIAIASLKEVTRREIIVIQARSSTLAHHDQVLDVDVPLALNDQQASIYLKTSVLHHTGNLAERYCYLDSDVIAINDGVDGVFKLRRSLINFANDHARIDTFSPWAVKCNCRKATCDHLREALESKFGISVSCRDWRMWNGGVFLFDEDSFDFLATWHDMACQIMADPYWETRDQGVLAGAAWKFGVQNHKPLPSAFNLIVDCKKGIARVKRPQISPQEYRVCDDYHLSEAGAPSFVHFINGGIGKDGWRNWDELKSFLRARPSSATSM